MGCGTSKTVAVVTPAPKTDAHAGPTSGQGNKRLSKGETPQLAFDAVETDVKVTHLTPDLNKNKTDEGQNIDDQTSNDNATIATKTMNTDIKPDNAIANKPIVHESSPSGNTDQDLLSTNCDITQKIISGKVTDNVENNVRVASDKETDSKSEQTAEEVNENIGSKIYQENSELGRTSPPIVSGVVLPGNSAEESVKPDNVDNLKPTGENNNILTSKTSQERNIDTEQTKSDSVHVQPECSDQETLRHQNAQRSNEAGGELDISLDTGVDANEETAVYIDSKTGSTAQLKTTEDGTNVSDHSKTDSTIQLDETATEDDVTNVIRDHSKTNSTIQLETATEDVTNVSDHSKTDSTIQLETATEDDVTNVTKDHSKTDNTMIQPKTATEESTIVISDSTKDTEQNKPTDLEANLRLSRALRFSCKALPWRHVVELATPAVTSLSLCRVYPGDEFNAGGLLRSLTCLRELDLSNNHIGPQGFRVLCLAMAKNTTLKSLNLANNLADTDSSKSLGTMLTENQTLQQLNVSGNELGKDYLSRCIGPALITNSTLRSLKCASCGSIDMIAICHAITAEDGNRTLRELDVSNNQLGEEFGKEIGAALKTKDCSLRVLDIHAVNLGPEGMTSVLEGLKGNHSLESLNIGGNKVSSCNFIVEFILSCISHANLKELCLDNLKPVKTDEADKDGPTVEPCGTPSSMTKLSLSGSALSDSLMNSLAVKAPATLPLLKTLDVSNNPDLTTESLKSICDVLCSPDSDCSIETLDFALNAAGNIAEVLTNEPRLKSLKHLSLRKCKVPPPKLAELSSIIARGSSEERTKMTSLNLDGIKLSGTTTLQSMLGISDDLTHSGLCGLTKLSLGGCGLNDKDVKPLFVAVARGLGITSVSLPGNRLTDSSCESFAESIEGTCALELLDVSNNKIRSAGAEALASTVEGGKLPNMSSLLMSNNCLDTSGLLALVSLVTTHSTLRCLNLKDQQDPVGEDDMEKIFETIAQSLQISLTDSDSSSTGYIDLSNTTTINLTSLGGEPGNNGALMDSLSIMTDYSRRHKRTLKLEDAIRMSAVLTNSSIEGDVRLTEEDWNKVIGADKDPDVPAWLQVAAHRQCAVYVSNLTITATRERLESLLEAEADCNVKEVILMKDPMLRKPTGIAWVLFTDEDSVTKAKDYYNSGQAQVYGRPFVISGIPVVVTKPEGNDTLTEDQARKEMVEREAGRKAEDVAKAAVVQSKYEESSARHEYAAQHPAYADGRIW